VSNSRGIYLNTNKDAIDALKTADPLPDSNNLSSGPQKVVTKTVMQAKAVHFTADNGDIFVNGVSFDRGNVATGSEFQARAKGTIGIYDSAVNHSKVAIAANTVVLKDVDFSYGSAVDLRSGRGLVAGNPGSGAAVLPGHVNFVSNVKYGAYAVDNLAVHGMAGPGGDAAFRNAMNQRHAPTTPGGVAPNFTKLTITDLAGHTK
jgi:hypothetical protein